ncbi:hypothetical protein RBH29_03920 [Herbivorax sp. ANBcel31]|uniref:hypothetical protein n=1 Tax=Herbivorax sp. ANBcel31 TaxID=3069754 RepID=UPI0027ADB669|nr:hypothetical protein [Herbivorax sp. ANBcel31]MDQ2085580.1 hypothetical protein [Herbivorax sp. ANBcel31]
MDIKKIENFWYYHKVKVFVAIFALTFIILGFRFNTGSNPDLEIGYVIENHGFALQNLEESQSVLESIIHKIDKDDEEDAEILLMPLAGPRIEIELGIGISHILIMDIETLEPFIDNYFFEPLDQYVDEYNIDISKHPEVVADPLDTNEPKVYALPVKYMQFLLDMGFPEDFYFTIRLPKEDEEDDIMKIKNAHIVLDYVLNYSN